MMLRYDPEADAAYVYVTGPIPAGGVARTDDVSRVPYYTRGIDYDTEGRILGYEFLNVSRGVDLTDLPHREALAAVFAKTRGIRVLETT
jgi:uncharacterized protein YuzE